MALSLWLFLDGAAGVDSIAGVDFCAAAGAEGLDLTFVAVIVGVVVLVIVRCMRCSL